MIINEYNLLKSAIDFDIIDFDTIQTQIELKKREDYLTKHTSKIWQSTDKNWYTYLYKDGKNKLVKRRTQEAIEDVVVKYYQDKEEHPTIKQAFECWIEEKLEFGEIQRATYDRYLNDFNRYVIGTELENMRVEDVDEDILEMFLRKRIAKLKLSPKNYANLRTLIIGLFKYSKRKKYTRLSISSFFRDLDISRKAFTKKKKTKESQVFGEDEIPIIINWLKDHPSVVHYGILLVFYTGIREGELAALKYSDIVGNRMHIQRQEIRYKSKETNKTIREIVEYTKSDAGDRYIFLPPQALEVVKEIRKLNPFGEYMIIKDGNKLCASSFNWYLYRACERCYLPKRSMHKIRKTYGTTLIDGGTDDSLVMNQMGHSDITTTRKYYYYSNKNDQHNQEQINNAICY